MKDAFLRGLVASCKSNFIFIFKCCIYHDFLNISTHGEDIVNPIVSARLETSDSFSFTYGAVEIRAQMPKGDWLTSGKYFFYSTTVLNG